MEQQPQTGGGRIRARTWSLWLAIGMLVAAGLLGAVFIVLGDEAGIAGRTWLTLVLASAFAGLVLVDAAAANGPNAWYFPASVSVNALLLIVGLLKTWGGFFQPADTDSAAVWSSQVALFLALILLLRLALVVTQTYAPRFVVRPQRVAAKRFATAALTALWVGVLLASLPLALPEAAWPDVWGRLVGAGALLTAILLLIPVVLEVFESRANDSLPAPGTPPAAPATPPAAAAPTPMLAPPAAPPAVAPPAAAWAQPPAASPEP